MTLQDDAAALFGVALTPQQAAAFDTYAALLSEWNTRVNLTAIVDPDGVRVRHFLDSLSLVRVLPLAEVAPLRIMDVGSGAGFPGLALAIAFPQHPVTVMEATGKKVAFLQHVIDTLALPHAHAVQARAEDVGQDDAHRAQYDVVVARAVARLPVLLEYLLPLARVGGTCVAMKGVSAHAEADDSRRALRALGGTLTNIEALHLPGVEQPHHLVVIHKNATTPPEFPRKPGEPSKQPLM